MPVAGRPAVRIHRRAVQPAAAVSWKVEIYSHTPFDVETKSNLNISIIGQDAVRQSAPTSVNPWSVKSWNLEDELLPGRIRSAEIQLDDSFGTPGGIVLTKNAGAGSGSFIRFVKLLRGAEELILPCNSWIWADNLPRVFFVEAALPKDTPPGLKEWRAKDLAALKGTAAQQTAPRKLGDRIFDYDTYNDLSDDVTRPNLGGSEYPFPRRLRTGRPVTDGKEVRPKKDDDWWLPPDEKFSYTKLRGFSKGQLLATLPAFAPMIQGKLGKTAFKSFRDLYSLLDTEGKGLKSLLPKELPCAADPNVNGVDLGKFLKLNDEEAKVVDIALNQRLADSKSRSELLEVPKPKNPIIQFILGFFAKREEDKAAGIKDFKVLFKGVDDISDILDFKVPTVLANRVDAWHTDEEFGRQLLAGVDPVLLKVVKSLPAGSEIKESHVEGLLGKGETLKSLFALPKPRLFLLDLFPVLEDFLPATDTTVRKDIGAVHAGRALLYKRADGFVVPIAIELKTSKASPIHVYTPKDPLQIWLLAKTVISNLDAIVHQGYSHFGRCHAATEPYIISTHRNLSSQHPVYRLLRPHFRYTLNINQNARRNLINGGGVVESGFTPGPATMLVVSKVYDAVWRFDTEGLPHDLKARGFMDEDGNLLVDDYPYAEDGMLYWNALSAWFKDYLSLYYKSDEDITSDEELTTWWDEIKTNGHPDKKVGWPALETLDDLVNILSTITFITSAHHSAVNFVQYDYTSFSLNKPSYIQKPMPAPGSPEYKALASAKGVKFEELFLSYTPPPAKAAKVALIVKLLSSHSLDEDYMVNGVHNWIKDGPGVEAYNRFVASLKNVEEQIQNRNTDPSKVTRNLDKGGLPYNVLLPSSPEPGVTARGVPYSVSI